MRDITEHLALYGITHFDDDMDYWAWGGERLGANAATR